MICIDKIGNKNFTLQEMYTFVPYLKTKYPNNRATCKFKSNKV